MAAPDRFAQWKEMARQLPTFPLTRFVNVDPIKSDGVDLPFLPRAIHVGVAGNIKLTAGGVTDTLAFEVGWHPISPTRIWAAPTTTALGVTAWD